MIPRRLAYACVAVAALLITVTACGQSSGGAPGATSGGGDNTIRVIWQPSGLSSYFYANAKNVWDKYHIKLQPIKIATGQAEIGALAGGGADIAFMGGPPTVTALGRGLPIQIISTTNDASALEGAYVNPKAGVKQLSDLKGKTIGVAKGSSADAGMHLSLKKAGVAASEINIRYMDPSQMLSSYQRGDIDGAWVWDTWGARLEAAGADLVATEHQFGVAEPNSWVATDGFLKDHADLVARFVAALNEGAIGANQDPRVAANEYASVTGVTTDQASNIMKIEPTATIASMLSPNNPLSFTDGPGNFADQLAITGNMLTELGVLQTSPSQQQIQAKVNVAILNKAKQVKVGG